MPHIHVRSSEKLERLNIQQLLTNLAKCLSSIETIQSESVKAYWSYHEHFEMGINAPSGFVHCEVSILEGRPEELKYKIADEMYSVLKQGMPDSNLSYTLELREMSKTTYKK